MGRIMSPRQQRERHRNEAALLDLCAARQQGSGHSTAWWRRQPPVHHRRTSSLTGAASESQKGRVHRNPSLGLGFAVAAREDHRQIAWVE